MFGKKTINQILSQFEFSKIEKYIFFLILLLNLLPVLSYKFFPTMDGAAHLYNSNLINEMVLGNKELHQYYIFNSMPVPNWIGHIILSFFNLFLPAHIAERILLISFLIGLPLAFRSLLKTISIENIHLSYIIFHFTYSFVFFLGFYNFLIALVFLLITLNYYIKNEENLTSIRKISSLLFLVTLTYFSHLFVFALLLLLIATRLGFKTFLYPADVSKNFKQKTIDFIRKSLFLLLSTLMPLLLFLNYLISKPASSEADFIEFNTLIEWLKNLRPLIALSEPAEQKYTRKIFYVIAALFIYALYSKLFSKQKPTESFTIKNLVVSWKSIVNLSDFWFISAVILLVMYFNMPDSDGSAGYVSIRLAFIFFIFLLLWIASQKLNKWIVSIAMLLVLFFHFKLNNYYQDATKNLESIAVDYTEVANHIESNSVVLPMNYSGNWLMGHFSNYLGVDKPMIILENYECVAGYFPLKWNVSKMPDSRFGSITSDSLLCLHWYANPKGLVKKIDYCFVMGNIDNGNAPCDSILKTTLNQNYHIVHTSLFSTLYRANK